MSHLPFQIEQLNFMVDLANHRLEWLDPFFRFLNYFDSPYFFFVLIPVVWLGISYQWGLRIFYWFTFSNLLINGAKNWIGWNRPSTDFPSIGLYHPSSYGFPSGGAMICMFLGGLLIYTLRTRAAWTFGIIYILLISFSRLYLGVHYPIDILGGWILAWIVLALYIAWGKPLEKWLIEKGIATCLVLSLAIPIAILIAFPIPSIRYVMGSTLGIGIGTYFSLKYQLFLPKSKNFAEGFARSFLGIALLTLILFLLPWKGIAPLRSFSAGLFMSLAASPICNWFLDQRKKR